MVKSKVSIPRDASLVVNITSAQGLSSSLCVRRNHDIERSCVVESVVLSAQSRDATGVQDTWGALALLHDQRQVETRS